MVISLVKRNLKCYFRDKASVFFSMLGVIIIISLYLLFLGNLIKSSSEAIAGESARFLMDSWIMGGVIAASTITTTLGAFGIMVQDQQTKIMRDFKSSPIKRWQLVLSYVISSMLIGAFMSIFTLVLAEAYISIDGSLLSFTAFLKVLGYMLLSVTASSAIVFFFINFVKSNNAYSAVATVVGTIVGFLTGVYIPIGDLPTGIQTVIKFFPPSHAAVLLRQVMMNEVIPIGNLPMEFKLFLGVNLEVNGVVLSNMFHIMVLVLTAIVFFALSLLVVSTRKEKE